MTTFDRETMDLMAEAERFVENYFRTFDANRADLVDLYQEESVMTFDGRKIQGKEGILAKLTSLPFQQCQHHIGTIDCLPFGLDDGVVVVVTGKIRPDGEQDALDFSQMFLLIPTSQGSFDVSQDLFRMNFEWRRQDGHLGFNSYGTAFGHVQYVP